MNIPSPPLLYADSSIRTYKIVNALNNNNLKGYYSPWKLPVTVATTENVTLEGLQIIDSVQLVNNDRILVKDQTNKVENGIYVVRNTSWFRSNDLLEGSNAAGLVCYVKQGTTNGTYLFYCTDTGSNIIVGTNEIDIFFMSNNTLLNAPLNSVLLKSAEGFIGYDSLTYNNNSLIIGAENEDSTVSTRTSVDPIPLEVNSSGLSITTNPGTIKSGNITIQTGNDTFESVLKNKQFIRNVVTDSENNMYAAGVYSNYSPSLTNSNGVLANMNGTLSNLALPTVTDGVAKLYISKYSSDGTIVSNTFTTTNNHDIIVNQVITDNNNNVYVTFYHSSSVSFPVYNFTNNSVLVTNFSIPGCSAGNYAVVIIKWNSSGIAQLWTSFEIANSTVYTNTNIAVDSNMSLYLSGVYNSSVIIPVRNMSSGSPGSSTFSMPSGNLNVYLIKWLSNGTADSWTLLPSVATTDSYTSTYKDSTLKIDSNDNVVLSLPYVSGVSVPVYDMSNSSNYITTTKFSLPACSISNTMLVSWTSSGTTYKWTVLHNTTGTGNYPTGLVINSGEIYLIGLEYDTVAPTVVYNLSSNSTLGPGTNFSLGLSGIECYIIKWNIATGSAEFWSELDNSEFWSIVVDSDKNVYTLGDIFQSASAVQIYNMSTNNTLVPAAGFTFPIGVTGGVFDYYWTLVKWNSAGTTVAYNYTNQYSNTSGGSMWCDNLNNIYVIFLIYPEGGYTQPFITINNNSSAPENNPAILAPNIYINSQFTCLLAKWLQNGELAGNQGSGGGGSITISSGNGTDTGYGNLTVSTGNGSSAGSINIMTGTSYTTGHTGNIQFLNDTNAATPDSLHADAYFVCTKLTTASTDVKFKNNKLQLTTVSVTIANFGTSPTIISKQGFVVITDPSSLGANSSVNLVVNNSLVISTSLIKASVNTYSGTGIPMVEVVSINSGVSFTIKVSNAYTAALDNTPLIIGFVIL